MRLALALAMLLLLPLPAGAHWYLRHAEHSVARTVAGDALHFGGVAAWQVWAPDLTELQGTGSSLAVPPGLPADGTWTLHVLPGDCAADPRVSWALGGKARTAEVGGCGETTWVFNWNVLPPPYPAGDGTMLLLAPAGQRLNTAELGEPTFYQDLTPYYTYEDEDWDTQDYELLVGNAHFMSERSRPDTDDDGDGVPNRADADWWVGLWLDVWARHHGLGPLPRVPSAHLAVEDAQREAARASPALSPWLQEPVTYAPGESAAGSVEVLTFRVPNRNGSLNPPLWTYAPRNLRDVLLQLRSPPGGALFEVDLAATRALAPAGWSVASWTEGGEPRVLFQTPDLGNAVYLNSTIDLRVVARARDAPGQGTWDVTMLVGSLAPQRRFAFLPAEVVP